MNRRLSSHCATVAPLAAAQVVDLDGARAQTIAPAPAFNAKCLSSLPCDEWSTNGRAISNQRYSPIHLVDRSNVARNEGVWCNGLERLRDLAAYVSERLAAANN